MQGERSQAQRGAQAGGPDRGGAAGVGDLGSERGALVGEPAVDGNELAGLAVNATEVPVVERDDGVPGGGEAFGVGVQAQGPDRPEALGHHDHRDGPAKAVGW